MNYDFFPPHELMCHCGLCDSYGNEMNSEFMGKLIKLRKECEFPFIVTSAYRCSQHNEDVGGSLSSQHLYGKAVDISIRGNKAYTIIKLAEEYGMKGVGISQIGSKRFVHLDDRTGAFALWSY